MFEGFNEPARQAVVLAQEEARALGHDHIGTEHLLLGLIGEGAGSASGAFARLGVTVQAARERVAAEVHQRPQAPRAGQLPFTPRAKGTLRAAPRQALGLKDDFIGTEHVLLALLIERDARTASILSSLGCPPDLLRTTLLNEREGRDDGEVLLDLAEGDGVAA